MLLRNISNLNNVQLKKIRRSASLLLAQDFVNNHFVIDKRFYNTCDFKDEVDFDVKMVEKENKKLLCLVKQKTIEEAMAIIKPYAGNPKAYKNDIIINKNMAKQRMITILTLSVIETVAYLKPNTISLITELVDDCKQKVGKEIKKWNMKAKKKNIKTTLSCLDVDYDDLTTWGLSKDECSVLGEIMDSLSHIVKQCASLYVLNDEFKKGFFRLGMNEIADVIDDENYMALAAEAFALVEVCLQKRIKLYTNDNTLYVSYANHQYQYQYQPPTYKTYTVEFKFNHQKMDMELKPLNRITQTGAVVVSCYTPFCKDNIAIPSLIVSINDKVVATMVVKQVFDILSNTPKPYSITFHLCADMNINILENLKESNEMKEIESPINILNNEGKLARESDEECEIVFSDLKWNHISQENICYRLNISQYELCELVLSLYSCGKKCIAVPNKIDEYRGKEYSLSCDSTGKNIFDVERKPKGAEFAVTIVPQVMGGRDKLMNQSVDPEIIRGLAYIALRTGTCTTTEQGLFVYTNVGSRFVFGENGSTLIKYENCFKFNPSVPVFKMHMS